MRTQIVCDWAGEIRLVKAVTCSQDMRAARLGDEVVDDVKEAIDAIRIAFPNRNEGNRNTGGNTNGILGVKILRTGC